MANPTPPKESPTPPASSSSSPPDATPPTAAPPKGDDGKAAKPPEDPEPPADAPDVLVENRRAGVTVGIKPTPAPNPAPGREGWSVEQLNLLPGLNLVPARQWWGHKAGLAHRIATSEIVVHDDWSKVPKPVALAAIRNSGDVKVLERLLAAEKRSDVAKLLEVGITEIKTGKTEQRRAAAAHSFG